MSGYLGRVKCGFIFFTQFRYGQQNYKQHKYKLRPKLKNGYYVPNLILGVNYYSGAFFFQLKFI